MATRFPYHVDDRLELPDGTRCRVRSIDWGSREIHILWTLGRLGDDRVAPAVLQGAKVLDVLD